jgi:integrase
MKKESTLDDVIKIWLEHHAKPHKKSWEDDESRYNLYIKKNLVKKKLTWFTPSNIRQWHQNITKLQKQRAKKGVTISPTTANRALVLLTTIFNQVAPDIANRCKGVPKFKEHSRGRFLETEELRRFLIALDDPQTPEDFKDYLMLSLFTTARRSNVLAIK